MFDPQPNIRLRQDPDGTGYFVAIMRADGTLAKRTLTTKNLVVAERWWRQARCHGFSAHTESCPDCRYS